MSNIALLTGLRALLSAQSVLDTVGHNIANANTPGYSRQRIALSSSLPLSVRGILIGTGVDASSAQRLVDTLLGRRILGQLGVAGELDARHAGLGRLEALLGQLDSGGLGTDVDAFFGSLSELSTAPDDPILSTGVVQSALAMTANFHQLAQSVAGVGLDSVQEIRTRVDQVNGLAEAIAELNLEIGETESGGLPANDLRDRRDRLLAELATQVDATTTSGGSGAIDVLVGGQVLVAGSRSNDLRLEVGAEGVRLGLAGSDRRLERVGGALGGLIRLHDGTVPDLAARLDRMAHQLALGVNRAHSTAIPAGGGFQSLRGTNPLQDRDGDGLLTDELVARAGLPFDVRSGAFHVNVVDQATGAVSTHRVELSETHTTVGQLLAELNAIPGLSAGLDASGRLTLLAGAGQRFDFSARLDADPDPAGTFGGGRASLGSAAGPFALAVGDTLDLTADPSGAAVPLSFTIQASDFVDVARATAEELAAVVNADPAAQAAGVVAQAVGGRLFLQTVASGAGAELRLDGGSAAAALGWSGVVGATVTGHDNATDVRLSGAFEGGADQVVTFRPTGDGTIGTTPGLQVEVLDAQGLVIATLDVGEGYVPGTDLDLGNGVRVAFELGELSATHGDAFAVELVADADTTDVLVALGLNSLLVGHDAAGLAVRSDLVADPSLLATSLSGASGDAAAVLRILDAEEERAAALGGVTLGQFWGELVGGVGFETASARTALESNQSLLASLEARHQQISGVNVDEELVDLLAFEQAFAAASQYISVVNQVADELLSIL